MPSLRRYEFRREVYELIDRDLLSSAENLDYIEVQKTYDPHKLSASYLVYFSVGESPVGNRSFAQVGSSLGYLLPILVVLGQDNSCGIEEPELHLHPTAQEELADVFLHANRPGRVIVIESHSELFLLKIARRMKETYERGENGNVHLMPAQQRLSVKPDAIGIYVFSSGRQRGAEVRQIKMMADGSLDDDWPRDIFDTLWASVLGRLSMFSKKINSDEVAREWPR
jgi:predicted ATPase